MINFLSQALYLLTMIRLTLKAIREMSQERAIEASKREMMREVAERINLKLKASAVIDDDDPGIQKLTITQKRQLGLFIPSSPFNARMSRYQQRQYLPHVTQQLYLRQTQFPTYLKILQDNQQIEQQGVTLDKYINLVYKDIYARYLMSRGIGVEWEGRYADVGVVSQYFQREWDEGGKRVQNYSVVLDFMQSQSAIIKQSKTIGLYSTQLGRFVGPQEVEVENIKKMGHYVKEQLTEFGQFERQFGILKDKNAKAYLLIFVQHLQKLIDPNGICVKTGEQFIILKRYLNSLSQEEKTLEFQYLLLAKDTFNKHQKYFKKNQYQKYSVCNSKHILGMKVKGIPIVDEIQGYSRSPGCYAMHSGCSLADFERANQHLLAHHESPVDERGQLWIDGQNIKLSVNDPSHLNKLEQLLALKNWNFMDFFDVFDDQLYFQSHHRSILNFRLGDKYRVDISNQATGSILEGLRRQGTIVEQSKIQIPSFVKGKKPRHRRALRKERKGLLQQITQHYSLEQSVSDLSSISISSLNPALYTGYIIRKDGNIVPFESALTGQELRQLSTQCRLPDQTIKQLQLSGYTVDIININDSLTTALLYLKNISNSQDKTNIIIEPQTHTENLIPYTLHLNHIINGSKRNRRGYLITNTNFKLIKLHPTLTEEYQGRNVRTILEGVLKGNKKEQYGMGYEALRLWTAKNDSYLGDRTISQTQVNSHLPHIHSIRRVFWDLVPLVSNKPLPSTLIPKLYLSTFMLDSIDCYIVHMQQAYKQLNLRKAYELTIDFFQNIVYEIYTKTVKKRIIAFPNLQENQEHGFVIRKILELVGVITPLFPFSAHHVAGRFVGWPVISNQKFYEGLGMHNEMVRLRVKVINKLRVNQMDHVHMFVPTLREHFTQRDLELFFDVDRVTTRCPAEHLRQCSLPLPRINSMTLEEKVTFYHYEEHCLRCDSKSTNKTHLCSNCHEYLEEHIGDSLLYFKDTTKQIQGSL